MEQNYEPNSATEATLFIYTEVRGRISKGDDRYYMAKLFTSSWLVGNKGGENLLDRPKECLLLRKQRIHHEFPPPL